MFNLYRTKKIIIGTVNIKEIMNEDIIREKIEKAIDLTCQLYKYDIITNAIIIGSVAKGTARKNQI